MKALTDKIVDSLQLKYNKANEEGFKSGLAFAIESIVSIEKEAEFEEVARVVIKHLNERNDLYHPHHTVLIDNINAQLLEGRKSTGFIYDYIHD